MYCCNARLIENGKFLRCKLDDNPCPYVRWCSVERKVKNSSSFFKCSKKDIETNDMAKKNTKKKEMTTNSKLEVKKAEEKEIVVESNEENKIKICPVILAVQGKTIFSLDGYGISHPKTFKGDSVEVEYQGKIGHKDFKLVDVREVEKYK